MQPDYTVQIWVVSGVDCGGLVITACKDYPYRRKIAGN